MIRHTRFARLCVCRMFFQCVRVRVKFYPQRQFVAKGEYSHFAPTCVENINSTTEVVEDIPDLRKRLDYRLWRAICDKDWYKWKSIVGMYSGHNLLMDEVSWSLLLHGTLMCHLTANGQALLILENMQSTVHPAVYSMNESLVNTFFELDDLGIKTSLNGWQNLTRLTWMSAARLRKKRANRVKVKLENLPTSRVLEISQNEVLQMYLNDQPIHTAEVVEPNTLIESDESLLDY